MHTGPLPHAWQAPRPWHVFVVTGLQITSTFAHRLESYDKRACVVYSWWHRTIANVLASCIQTGIVQSRIHPLPGEVMHHMEGVDCVVDTHFITHSHQSRHACVVPHTHALY